MSNILEFVIKFKDQMSSGITAIGANVDRTFSRIDGRSRQVSNSIQGINARLDALQRTRDISVNLRDIRQANREMQSLERQRDRLSGRGGGPGGAIRTGIAVAGAGMMLRESVMQATRQQGIEDAIRFSMGKTAGSAMLGHIKERSNTLGLDQMASLEGAKTFLGATSGKLSELDQVKTFDAVSEAITSFKLSGEDAKGVYLALGQMASKGTVSAEELRGQIGERIPGAFSLAAKAMGVTEAALGDMMQKGELAANVFLPKFAAELHKTFGVEAINSSDSAQANFNRLNNALNDVKNKIGTELLPAMAPFIQMLIQAFNWVSANIVPILSVAAGIGAVVLAVKAWAMAQRILNLVMAANPLGIVIVAIGLAIAAVTALIAKFGSFSKAMEAVWNTVKLFSSGMWDAFKDIGDAIWTSIKAGVLKALDWLVRLGTSTKNFLTNPLDGFTMTDTPSKYGAMAAGLETDRAGRRAANVAAFTGKMQEINKIWATDKSSKASSPAYNFGNSTASALAGGNDAAARAAKSKVGSDVNGITGGGTRNTYINLGKFQDSVNIHVANAKEGVDQLAEMIDDRLLRILNSAQ
jgi:tape measure domain-containing protein